MNRLDNSVLSYIATVSDVSDCDLKIEEHDGQKFLILYVDVPKIDYDSPSFDGSYRRKILGTDMRKNHPIPGLISSKVFLNRMVNEVKKFFGDEIKYETAFFPKNYEYLEDYEKKIEKITKEVEPQIDIEIVWDQDYPVPILKFYFNGKMDIETKDKLSQKIKERINLDTFRTILVHGPKKD